MSGLSGPHPSPPLSTMYCSPPTPSPRPPVPRTRPVGGNHSHRPAGSRDARAPRAGVPGGRAGVPKHLIADSST
eukprot:scaffold7946_cov116-Isochrysis_galbana.AAC.4